MFQLYVSAIESRFVYLLNTFIGSCDPFGVLFESCCLFLEIYCLIWSCFYFVIVVLTYELVSVVHFVFLTVNLVLIMKMLSLFLKLKIVNYFGKLIFFLF